MDSVTVQVRGLKQVQEALGAAGPALMRSAVLRALDAGAEVFLEGAKARCPVLAEATPHRQPGELRDAIAEVTTIDVRRETGRARVGLKYTNKGTEDPGVYGLFVEFGTRHMAAQPFMRPAYDAGRDEAISVFAEEIRQGVSELKK
jgi:HK97 gp10 family phage protein